MAKKEKEEIQGNGKMPMSLTGLKILVVGLLVMIAGYILLVGGGSDNPAIFNEDMFDFRRLVAAPAVIVCGIIIEIVAIMGRFTKKEE